MKHNFINGRHLDASATETKGGADVIIKAVNDLGETLKKEANSNKELLEKSIKDTTAPIAEDAQAAKVTAQKALEKVEEIEKKQATNGLGGGQGQVKSFGQQVEENLNLHKSKLPATVGQKFSFDVEIQTKAVGNMASSTSLTGSYFVAPTVVPGIVMSPFNEIHMRNILSTGSTNSNVIRHMRDNGGEGGPTTVAEGAAKPQMDRDLSIVDAPVRKIATHLRVPEEMIEDIPFLTSFLTEVGTEEVLAVEDAQILYGDGTGQNLTGLGTSGSFTAFAAGTSVVASPNEYDVLGAAAKQMRVAKRTPSIALVSPTNYYDMISRKDSTGNYILQGGGNGLQPNIAGIPVVQLNQVAAGDFFVIDRRAAQIFFRSNISVRFYEQDQDNAIKNLVTIVIEERLALPIYFVNGIIKGTFSAGITDLTS
jgi:HK97 family phage major capsid protein